MEEQRLPIQNDEIELIDLIRVLFKRKKMIIGTTLLITALAVALCFILPQKYNVSFLLELGQDEQGKAIVSPSAVKVAIDNDAYVDALRSKLSLNERTGLKFKIQTPKNTELLYAEYQTAQPELGLKVLLQLRELIEVDVNKKLEQKKTRLENEISLASIEEESWKKKVKLLDGQIEQQHKLIKNLTITRQNLVKKSAPNAVALLLYSNEIKGSFEYLNQMNEELTEDQTEILSAHVKVQMLQATYDNLHGLYAYKNPTVSDRPISPKKPLIVALGFMLGVMGSVMLAFLREYLQQHKLDID